MGAHALGHFSGAILGVLVLFAASRWLPKPPPGWIGRTARTVLMGGLAIFALGQTAEVIGAFGYRGGVRLSWLATVHDIAVWVGAAGTNITIFGALLTTMVLLLERFGKLESRWVPVAFAVATIGVVAFVIGGIVFGY